MTLVSRRDLWSVAVVAIATAMIAVVAPRETVLTLAVVAIVILVSGYISVGILTAAIVAPLLIAIGVGASTRAFGISLVSAFLAFWSQRPQIRRLRAGKERQLGRLFTRSTPGEKPGVGLWDTPAPHGLLGPSALTPGAVLIIILSVLIAGVVAGMSR